MNIVIIAKLVLSCQYHIKFKLSVCIIFNFQGYVFYTDFFYTQLALTRVLLWLGLKPDGLLGHSVGELGCAYADGTLSVEQTVAAAYWRGQSIKDAKLSQGAMAAVGKR